MKLKYIIQQLNRPSNTELRFATYHAYTALEQIGYLDFLVIIQSAAHSRHIDDTLKRTLRANPELFKETVQ